MPRLVDLETRLVHLHALQDLVRALRGIAAGRVQEGLGALDAARRYAATIADAIGLALALFPEPPPVPQDRNGGLRLVIGTEQGFVGALTEKLIASAIGRPRGWQVAIVGRRTAALATDQGVSSAWTLPMAANLAGIGAVARRVAEALHGAVAVELAYLARQGGSEAITLRRIVPIDLAALAVRVPGMPPLHHGRPEALLAALAGEQLLAELTLALTEALVAENDTRMRVMHAADGNIGDRRRDLGLEVRRLRQEAITTELLDVVTGAEAVGGGEDLPDGRGRAR